MMKSTECEVGLYGSFIHNCLSVSVQNWDIFCVDDDTFSVKDSSCLSSLMMQKSFIRISLATP